MNIPVHSSTLLAYRYLTCFASRVLQLEGAVPSDFMSYVFHYMFHEFPFH